MARESGLDEAHLYVAMCPVLMSSTLLFTRNTCMQQPLAYIVQTLTYMKFLVIVLLEQGTGHHVDPSF
jgi:hypothetical protein